ncbi:MAG: hypothetical protein WA892_03250, partial [Ornithinimicrobium sp.]
MSGASGEVAPADLARGGFTRTSRSARVIGDVAAVLGAGSAEVDVPRLVADLGAVADPDAAALAVVRL